MGAGHERVLVMFELRMSSSLTTLFMSFWLSSSTMRIFHWAGLAGRRAEERGAHVAASRLADGVEDDWSAGQPRAAPVQAGPGDIRSRWMSIRETDMAAAGYTWTASGQRAQVAARGFWGCEGRHWQKERRWAGRQARRGGAGAGLELVLELVAGRGGVASLRRAGACPGPTPHAHV